MASGFGSIDPKAGSGKYKDEARIDEVLGMHKFVSNTDFSEFRFLHTPILPLKQHWIKIIAGKDNKEIKVSRWCIAFDPTNEKVPRKGVTCPYCSLSQGEDGACQTSVKYYANAIVRDLQADMPRAAMKQKLSSEEKKTGFIQQGSKTWTPVRVLALPGSLAEKIQKAEKRNIHKNKKTGEKESFPVTHPKYGIDIAINFDNDKAGGDKYSIDRGELSPITEEEKAYLTWCLDSSLIEKLGVKSQEEANEDFKRMKVVGGTDIDDDEEEEDSLGSKKKSGKKPVKKSGKKSSKFDEDDEEEEDEDSLGSKKKSGKKPVKKPVKKTSKFDDDDDKPAKKSGKKLVKKTTSKVKPKKK